MAFPVISMSSKNIAGGHGCPTGRISIALPPLLEKKKIDQSPQSLVLRISDTQRNINKFEKYKCSSFMEIQKFFASCSLYKSDVLNRGLIGSLNNHTRMRSLIILRSMSFCGHLSTQEPIM